MASNFPGPYQVEINYTVDDRPHIMRLNTDCDGTPIPGTPPASINLLERGGSTVNLGTAVNTFVALLAPMYFDDASFNSYTFWVYQPGTYNRTYITGGSLAIVGSVAGTTVPASYNQLTFGTYSGGKMSIVMVENRADGTDKRPLANPGFVDVEAIRDYVLSEDAWMIGYDNSHAIRPINYLQGRNEALFKKYFR